MTRDAAPNPLVSNKAFSHTRSSARNHATPYNVNYESDRHVPGGCYRCIRGLLALPTRKRPFHASDIMPFRSRGRRSPSMACQSPAASRPQYDFLYSDWFAKDTVYHFVREYELPDWNVALSDFPSIARPVSTSGQKYSLLCGEYLRIGFAPPFHPNMPPAIAPQ